MKHVQELHPYDLSNLWKRITICFAYKFMLNGYVKEWEIEDISATPHDLCITDNYHIDKQNNIWKLLITLNKRSFCISASCYVGSIVLSMINVFIYAAIINSIFDLNDPLKTINFTTITLYCLVFLFTEIIRHILSKNYWIFATFCELKTRNIITYLLLNKLVIILNYQNFPLFNNQETF
eukprot:133923_1